MRIHAISTGKVQITQNWRAGQGEGPRRLFNTLFDPNMTEWLPIFCYVIEHPEGLIVVDTGIPRDANAPIFFPPWMRLVQRAAKFRISPEEEIGPQMCQRGLNPEDVRWVVLTHLHQDHDGGLRYFPKAEFLVSRAEWQAAKGLKGRMGGYLNQRWPAWFSPTLVDFTEPGTDVFPNQQRLTKTGDIYLVPTPGHSPGHMAVLAEEAGCTVMLAGDSAYSQAQLLADTLDGISPDLAGQRETHHRIMAYAAKTPTVYLPCHEWDAERRLAARETIG